MKPHNYPTEPAHLWDHFYAISQIPRPSGREEAVRSYVISQAEKAGLHWQTDAAGNLCIRVPASEGWAGGDTVIIQNHLDMVTVKNADKDHDFETDPLSLVVEDEWLRADRTTLGADNGVGCAAALALIGTPGLAHPPLELLFTVDEETGLHGALDLDPALVSGGRMLNLDTEDWQELFVGCAGGGGRELRRRFPCDEAETGRQFWQLDLSGLAGGHSGIQIHQQLGNAVKLLAQCLREVPGLQLAAADAGVAHNVIPREGRVTFACEPAALLTDRLEELRQQFLSYLPEADAGLQLTLSRGQSQQVLSSADSQSVLDLLSALPHGALAYNAEYPADLVDLSINLAVFRLREGELFVETSYRFFNELQSLPLQQSLMSLARAFSMQMTSTVGYPGWQPDFDSALLAQARELHRELFAVDPEVKAIHAGLECGIIKSKKPELDILSFGPTIRGAHSPAEKLQIATVEPFWRFLTALLARM